MFDKEKKRERERERERRIWGRRNTARSKDISIC